MHRGKPRVKNRYDMAPSVPSIVAILFRYFPLSFTPIYLFLYGNVPYTSTRRPVKHGRVFLEPCKK